MRATEWARKQHVSPAKQETLVLHFVARELAHACSALARQGATTTSKHVTRQVTVGDTRSEGGDVFVCVGVNEPGDVRSRWRLVTK